jgi:hypothetical protein
MKRINIVQIKENKMNGLQKMGGVAALIEAATFVVGFGCAKSQAVNSSTLINQEYKQ